MSDRRRPDSGTTPVPDADRTHDVGRGYDLARLFPTTTILGSSLLLGVAADIVLRAPVGPGLGIVLWFALLAHLIWWIARRGSVELSTEANLTIAVAVVLSSGVILRAAPYLQVFLLLTAAAAMTFPALRAGAGWLARGGVSDQLESVVASVFNAGLGPIRMLVDRSLSVRMGGVPSSVRGVVLGAVIAAPFLVIFGWLFGAADPSFARILNRLSFMDIELAAEHLVVSSVFAWLACGYLTGFVRGTRVRDALPLPVERPGLRIVEVATALALVDLLFLVFVVLQFQYLFGGSDWVLTTTDLTYAEYARQGFAQLVFATALVLPMLLAADWILVRSKPGHQRVFTWLSGLQLVLLGVIVASAFQRVRAYQDAYGFTQSRLLATVFLGWLILVGVGFALTVLRRRRDRFAFPMLISGYATLVLLVAFNPDAWIARRNLAREAAPDVGYLQTLSADAVPVLVGAVDSLPDPERCSLARGLLERWGSPPSGDWRGWNHSISRASRIVKEEASRLRRCVATE